MSATWLIWDAEGMPPKDKGVPILWRSYGEGDKQGHSIPRLVEEQSDLLHPRYLAWLYDMGEAHIEGQRLVDHLELRPGFSYWWMTLITGKCNAYTSFHIVDALKLLALEKLAGNHSISSIILVSSNKALAQTLRLWCEKACLIFDWQPSPEIQEPIPARERLYNFLPQPAKAFIWLMRCIWQWRPQKQTIGHQNKAEHAEMIFVDYLIHLDKKSLTDKRFASNFWTDLVNVLDRSGSQVNWLHHYIQHEMVSSTKQARELIDQFNQSGAGRQFHTLLYGALSFSVVLAALIDYSRLLLISLRLNRIRQQFCPGESRLDLWPLFRQEWRNSMRGPYAILNCLVLNLFERTFKRLPQQNLGIYLQENQGWEMAMIHAWKAAGHGRLIGVPHATVRYWDLRYFYDPRTYQRTGKNDLPLPDKSALNGPAAVAAYRKGGYPADKTVEVEALRYLYLADLPPGDGVAKAQAATSLRVLVPVDYLLPVTQRQMQWLAEAAPLLPPDTQYIVKAHPNRPMTADDYPSLPLQITSLPVGELLGACDVVFASNVTSVAVDAYCSGLPVVSMLDGNTFNMSPLRGLAGVTYVTNPAELAEALRTSRDCARTAAQPYFCLDKGLPRWRKLLGLGPDATGKPAGQVQKS